MSQTASGRLSLIAFCIIVCVTLLSLCSAGNFLTRTEGFEQGYTASTLLGPLPPSTVILLNKSCLELFSDINYQGERTCLPLGHYYDPIKVAPIVAAKSLRVQQGTLLQLFGVGGEDWSSNDKTEFPQWTVPFQIKEFMLIKTDLVGWPSTVPPEPWEFHRAVEDVPVEADLSNIVAISPGAIDGADAGRWPFPIKKS